MTPNAELIPKFVALGMSEQKAIETLKNANVTKQLEAALTECIGIELPEGAHVALPLLVKLIVDKKLDTTVPIDVALDYLLSRGQSKELIDAVELVLLIFAVD